MIFETGIFLKNHSSLSTEQAVHFLARYIIKYIIMINNLNQSNPHKKSWKSKVIFLHLRGTTLTRVLKENVNVSIVVDLLKGLLLQSSTAFRNANLTFEPVKLGQQFKFYINDNNCQLLFSSRTDSIIIIEVKIAYLKWFLLNFLKKIQLF